MIRQASDAFAVQLGAIYGQKVSQLADFRLRALRADAATKQRHFYITAWREVQVVRGEGIEVLAIGDGLTLECERISSCASRADMTKKLRDEKWAAIAVLTAVQRGSVEVLPLFALEVTLALVLQMHEASFTTWVLTLGAQAPEDDSSRRGPAPRDRQRG